MNDFNLEFYNPVSELDNKYSKEIHLHRIPRGGKKCDIIIQGLIFESNDDSKEFIKSVSTKTGVGGSHKMIDKYDKNNKVYIFTGDKRDDIVDILINKYEYEKEFIKYYG